MTCAAFVNLVEWKIWKWSKRVCWTKIISMYNSRNIYQLKDIQPWLESLKGVQVCVIEKSNDSALAHYSCKNTAKNFDSTWHRHRAKIILDKNSAIPLHCCDCLGISSWMCGADCWSVSESGTENISTLDSSSESLRFLVAGKKPSRLHPFSWKYLNPWTVFRHSQTVSSSAHWKLVSYPFLWTMPAMLTIFLRPFTNGERRKRSMAALRWISLLNFC